MPTVLDLEIAHLHAVLRGKPVLEERKVDERVLLSILNRLERAERQLLALAGGAGVVRLSDGATT
ncbi:MAG: hypothetical protein ACRCTG_14530 [Aestuariivirga sp.]